VVNQNIKNDTLVYDKFRWTYSAR